MTITNLCKYCSKPANYPPKTKYGGWCCSSRFYDCAGYKLKINLARKNTTKENGFKVGNIPWNKGMVGSGTFSGKKHTNETKLSISNSLKGNRNANHRGDRQSYYKTIRMDSSWEVAVANYLDDNNIFWKYNEYGYKLSNGRWYYPDFFIYENNNLIKLIEVKGYFREANRLKFEMFISEYPEIVIELWQKDMLKSLKIINSSGYVI